ncbi:MAG: hypothetical protein IT435_06910 [Phycisphaerales bacterium]|nr:hypothetical protein [Phycisphaerales bacterium]
MNSALRSNHTQRKLLQQFLILLAIVLVGIGLWLAPSGMSWILFLAAFGCVLALALRANTGKNLVTTQGGRPHRHKRH